MEVKHAASGKVYPGMENAEACASKIAEDCNHSRACGIAIVNCTENKLVKPRYYVHAGRILTVPLEIGPNCTGLIAAKKTYGSIWGAVGVISYSIEGTGKHLQIYYDVPTHRLWFEVQANVMVGAKKAREDLFDEMEMNLHGELTLARHTVRFVEDVDGFDIEFVMGDTEKSPLTVYLRPHIQKTPKKRNVTRPRIPYYSVERLI